MSVYDIFRKKNAIFTINFVISSSYYFEGGGHCPMDQIPELVNKEILRYVSEKFWGGIEIINTQFDINWEEGMVIFYLLLHRVSFVAHLFVFKLSIFIKTNNYSHFENK